MDCEAINYAVSLSEKKNILVVDVGAAYGRTSSLIRRCRTKTFENYWSQYSKFFTTEQLGVIQVAYRYSLQRNFNTCGLADLNEAWLEAYRMTFI